MRILHVITDLDVGGAEMMLAKLVGAMDRRAFENVVVSLMPAGEIGARVADCGIRVESLGMHRGLPSPLAILRLASLIRTYRPHVVQSWLYHADVLATVATFTAGRMPIIWNLRCSDMDMRYYSYLSRIIVKVLAWLSRRPAAIVVNSDAGKLLHERLGYRPRRWEKIPNGFDLERFKPDADARTQLRAELKIAADATVVAMVARVDPMKDHETFLAAAARVAAVRPGTQFLLIGSGTANLAVHVARHGLSGRCHLLGLRRDLEQLLPGIDIVCLASIGEGFPNVLGEAMAAGVPCVSTDVGEAREIIGNTGGIVPTRDAEQLASALVELIDRGNDGRAKLGAAARNRIAERYSLSSIAERYQQLYSEIAGGAGGAGTTEMNNPTGGGIAE